MMLLKSNFSPTRRRIAAHTLVAVLLPLAAVGVARAQTPPTAPPPAPDSAATPAPEQQPTPSAANYNVQYNGLIDAYYNFQFQNPRDTNALTSAPIYNQRHNTPSLSLAELNVFANARPGGLGFKATFIAGDTADINHADFPTGANGAGESRFKNIQQLFATYSFGPGGGGADFGKFYTPFGYEVTESNANYNYSRALPFQFEPFYHAGLRIYSPTRNGFTATAYVVNALFNTQKAGVQDDNKSKDFIGQLNYTDPKGKFVAITTLGGGKDKLPDQTRVLLSDTDFTYNVSPRTTLGANYAYANLRPDGGDRSRTHGYALYYKQTLTPRTGFALRYSGLSTKTDNAGGSVRPQEVTATYELRPRPNLITRLEYRHDFSNTETFLGSDSLPTKKNQDTLTLSGVLTF